MELAELGQDRKVRLFLDKVCREVRDKSKYDSICDELLDMISCLVDEYMSEKKDETSAISKAVKNMGSPAKIGKSFNKRYRVKNYYIAEFKSVLHHLGGLFVAYMIMLFSNLLIGMFHYKQVSSSEDLYNWTTGNFNNPLVLIAISVASVVSAYLTYRNFSKLRYILICWLVPPLVIIFNLSFSSIREPFLSIGESFLLDPWLYPRQLIMVLVMFFAGLTAILWFNSKRYFEINYERRIKSVAAISISLVLLLSVQLVDTSEYSRTMDSKVSNLFHRYSESLINLKSSLSKNELEVKELAKLQYSLGEISHTCEVYKSNFPEATISRDFDYIHLTGVLNQFFTKSPQETIDLSFFVTINVTLSKEKRIELMKKYIDSMINDISHINFMKIELGRKYTLNDLFELMQRISFKYQTLFNELEKL